MNIALGFTPNEGIPNISDLGFFNEGRININIPDSINGNDGKIIPSVGLIDVNNYLTKQVSQFGNVNSGYVEFRVKHSIGQNTQIFGSADEADALNYIYFYIGTTNKPTISCRSTNGSTFNNAYVATNAISAGWHTIRFASDGSNYTISVDGSPVAGSAVIGTDTGEWFADVLNRDNITVGYLKTSSPLYCGALPSYIGWVDFNGTNHWHINGLGLYEYEIGSINHFTWTGSDHTAFGDSEDDYYFSNGFRLYQKGGELDEYVPYGVDVSILLSTYSNTYSRSGNSSYIINYPGMIDFDPLDVTPAELAIFDRSNTTICSDLARSGDDYDASNPYRWLIQDLLNPEIYYTFREKGYETFNYQRILYANYRFEYIEKFLVYGTIKDKDEKLDIEIYCRIDALYFKMIENRVSVKSDGSGDYTTIQEAIDGITDAASDKVYCIDVYDNFEVTEVGDYTVDNSPYHRYIVLKNYVYLMGHGSIVIDCSLPETATDAQTTYYENLVAEAITGVYGITFTQKNGRYALHIDKSAIANDTQRFDYCEFIHYGNQEVIDYRIANSQAYSGVAPGLNAVGLGTYTGNIMIFNDCEITGIKPFGYHTNTDFIAAASCYLNRSKLVSEGRVNTTYNPTGAVLENILLYCLTSGLQNQFIINNCDLNSWVSYWGSYHDQDELDIYILNDIEVINYGTALDFRNIFVEQGSLRITSTNGGGSISITGGTAESVIMPSSDEVDNYATGRLEVGEWSRNTDIALGPRLGDCSGTPKTLEMSIDGGGTTTVTFDEDFTAQNDSYVLAFIDTELAGAATASLYQRAQDYVNTET